MFFKESEIRNLVVAILSILFIFSCAQSFGVYHRIKKGETLYSISRLYKSEVDKLKEINNIPDETKLKEGDYIFIPDVQAPLQDTAVLSKENDPGSDSSVKKIDSAGNGSVKKSSSKFIWPAKGVVTSTFGVRWGSKHEGIDIGCPEGTEVFAAGSGKVIFSGERGGYGLVIIIQHDGDLITIYAHNSKNLVEQGAEVKQGEKIALSGKTGRATGPHLHFEVRQGIKPVDPVEYLPTVP